MAIKVANTAALDAIQECAWVKRMMREIGSSYDSPITLFLIVRVRCTICLANNSIFHKRGKRIDIKYHGIREKVRFKNGVVSLLHASSEEMVAVILTKS